MIIIPANTLAEEVAANDNGIFGYGGSYVSLAAVGDVVVFIWNDSAWQILGGYTAAGLTVSVT